MFGLGVLVAAASVFSKTYLKMDTLSLLLVVGMAGGMCLLIVSYLVRGLLRVAAERETADTTEVK